MRHPSNKKLEYSPAPSIARNFSLGIFEIRTSFSLALKKTRLLYAAIYCNLLMESTSSFIHPHWLFYLTL